MMIGVALMIVSCGNNTENSTSKKFNPQAKTSKLSDSEREEAIAKKRKSLAVLTVEEAVKMQGVKFSILPPAVTKDLSLDASDKLCVKMIQVAAQNGVSGLCTNPVLAMVAQVNRTESAMTNTIPQRAVVKYEVTYYCGNLITHDIYASCKQSITGVGPNFDEAAENAFDQVENNKQMSDMFANASERAIEWYSATNMVKSLVEQYMAEENYALALALLNSVPIQADSTYAYALERSLEVTRIIFEENASQILAGMQSMIAENDTSYNVEVGAMFKMISPRSAVYAEAKKCFEEYTSRVHKFTDDKRKMEQELAAEKRNREYEIAADIRNKEFELAKEELTVRKVTAPLEAQATLEKMKIDASVEKSSQWSSALSSAAASIGHGMRGGMFGENGMFGKGGILGIGSFAEPLNKAVDGTFSLFGGGDDDED